MGVIVWHTGFIKITVDYIKHVCNHLTIVNEVNALVYCGNYTTVKLRLLAYTKTGENMNNYCSYLLLVRCSFMISQFTVMGNSFTLRVVAKSLL